MTCRRANRGFTLIELVVVIIMLGILAAVAIPAFVDMRSDANRAALGGVAGALSSAAAVNYASRVLNPAYGVPVGSCAGVQAAMFGGLPSGYSVTGPGLATGVVGTCTVSGPPGTTSFVAIGIT